MKKILGLITLMLFAFSFLTGCANSAVTQENQVKPKQITVSAAASLREAAEELQAAYTKQHPNIKITYNFGASGTLQKQIEEGAPADIFISAGQKQMDALAEKGLINKQSRQDLLGNELVLIASTDSKINGFNDLTKPEVNKISIGTPESVPAGKYAQESLKSLNLWDVLQPKLALAKDVRQVLSYVETGNVAAGLVYRSDALLSKKIKIICAAPEETHKPIVYPMAVLQSTKQQKAAADYAAYLASPEAAKVFAKYGFKPIK